MRVPRAPLCPRSWSETMTSQTAALETFALTGWHGPFNDADRERALRGAERGKVLYFPELEFVLPPGCADLLSPVLLGPGAKNISYDPASGAVKGTAATDRISALLKEMMAAFSQAAARFVGDLLPAYAGHIAPGRTSYRPVEIAGREYSPLKDDRRLHIDAFPSTPTGGRRILRLFSNIDPAGRPRLWHVGEPFEGFVGRFLPAMGRPSAVIAWLLAAFGATRGRRTAYDQLMLGLHNRAKRDAAFQAGAAHQEAAFAAGSSWLCFTDQVVHAALAGQYALEQTFYVAVEAMAEPAASPLATLERMTGRKLR